MLSMLAIVAVLISSSSSSSLSLLLCQRTNVAVVAFSISPTKRSSRISIATTPIIAALHLSKSSIPDNENVNGSSGSKRSEKTSTTKKRRFLQQAHPVRDAPANSPQQKQQARRLDTSDAFAAPTSSTTPDSNRPENTRIGPPLRTNKSIEELEAILEKRFGTTTASISLSPQPKKKMNAMANRVLDPWAKEEKGVARRTDSASKPTTNIRSNSLAREKSKQARWNDENYDANETQLPPSQSQRQQRNYNQEDVMLNKVRLNQVRLQSKKRGGGKGGDIVNNDEHQRTNSSKNRYNDELNIPVINVSRRDYYDEDDEGYEEEMRKNRRRRNDDDDNDPNAENWQNKRNKKSSSSILSGGGIFFSNTRSIDNGQQQPQDRQKQLPSPSKDNGRATNASKYAEKVKDEAKEVERLKRKDPVSSPLLDEDGKEMFLTLEQADKIVKSILSSTKSSSTSIDSNVGMSDADDMFVDDDTNEDNDDVNSINQWEDIGITDQALLSNLRSNNKLCCPYPLAAQDRACPPIVAGNDVLLSTHTGSGKTLAFLAPIAQSLLINGSGGGGSGAFPKAIVIAPGRELASQIVSVAQSLLADTGLTVALAIGGTPYSRNVEKLRKMKPDVVVGVSCHAVSL